MKRPSSEKPPPAKRARTKSKLKFKSPAEFFAENKNIAGFDNPGKSLYTTIRELVENGLDAAESVDALPEIAVIIKRIDKEMFRDLVGIEARNRVDESLYKDVETERERKKREKLEARKKVREEEGGEKKEKRKEGEGIYKVTVIDNGCGMAHEDVPNMMGRVLAGTKYCVRQARGKFGLGSKMALIWSKMSTGLPVTVETCQKGEEITRCILDIDIAKNVPTIIEHVKRRNEGWRGSRVSVVIKGNWTTYRSKIMLYMRQMAVITPYAKFSVKFESGDARDFEIVFYRRTDKMPRAATEVKHHPSSVNQLILKQLMGEVRAKTSILRFLTTQFQCIPRKLAIRLIKELGFDVHKEVSAMSLNDIRQLDSLLHEARFERPDGNCLSPAGEYNLRLGISKELKPDMVATHSENADVFEGHPFIIEVGVALGGVIKPGINVFRFANRIPLLFEGGNDVVTKTAKESIKWGSYKISCNSDRIGVICSIVSTKIPFKGTGKEYIGDDAVAIKQCVKRAITQCCAQLRSKLVRKAAQKDALEKKKNILRYVPDVSAAIVKLFTDLSDGEADTKDVADKIKSNLWGKDEIALKLVQHVEQMDREQALEQTTVDKKDKEITYLSARSRPSDYINVGREDVNMKLCLLSNVQELF